MPGMLGGGGRFGRNAAAIFGHEQGCAQRVGCIAGDVQAEAHLILNRA